MNGNILLLLFAMALLFAKARLQPACPRVLKHAALKDKMIDKKPHLCEAAISALQNTTQRRTDVHIWRSVHPELAAEPVSKTRERALVCSTAEEAVHHRRACIALEQEYQFMTQMSVGLMSIVAKYGYANVKAVCDTISESIHFSKIAGKDPECATAAERPYMG